MLLSRDAIIAHHKKGTVVIDPFDDQNLKTTSYDVTLGEYFWREAQPAGRATVHNLYDAESTRKIWSGPFQAELAKDVEDRLGIKLINLRADSKIILLQPQETILAHTIEFIGGRDIVVAKMYARSSMGRNFIEVCKDAGWGDVGYFNRWTMEVTNNSRYYAVPLVVGRRIAQMVFYEVAPVKRESDYAAENGKYQTSQNLDELKRTWNPQMMVPQMHKDWEIAAGK